MLYHVKRCTKFTDTTGQNRYSNVTIYVPSNVDWSESIRHSLSQLFGEEKKAHVTYDLSRDLVKVADKQPYSRTVVSHRYFADLGCVASCIDKTPWDHDLDPSSGQLVDGRSLLWTSDELGMSVVLHTPALQELYPSRKKEDQEHEEDQEQEEEDYPGLYGWTTSQKGDAGLESRRVRVVVRFRGVSEPLPKQGISHVVDGIMLVWGSVYNTNNLYTLTEAREVFMTLPTAKRRLRRVRHRHFASGTDFMNGYAALSSNLTKKYLVHMHSGLWMYHISTNSLSLVSRDTHTLNLEVGMLSLPVLLYVSGTHACLDPVMPHSCPQMPTYMNVCM